jgi:hypothetical protein
MIGYITAGLVLQGKYKFSKLDVNAVLTDFCIDREKIDSLAMAGYHSAGYLPSEKS